MSDNVGEHSNKEEAPEMSVHDVGKRKAQEDLESSGDNTRGVEGPQESWGQYNLLSFDGGGIRGYWALLVLKKLMKAIADEEMREDEGRPKAEHSFDPEAWPDNVSHAITSQERADMASADDSAGKCRALHVTKRYLPCHYFDLICGSSTGALIAIMLGRFRMTVPDCIDEYRKLGNRVFGHPRTLHQMSTYGLVKATKYRGQNLKEVIEDATYRRSEQSNDTVRFALKRGVCRTFVTTLMRFEDKPESLPYLIRSYDHESKKSPAGSRTPTFEPRRRTTNLSDFTTRTPYPAQNANTKHYRAINYEEAQNLEIWQVARAATAADFYFEPLKITAPGSSTGQPAMILGDGGFSINNNPTREGADEIEEMFGEGSVGLVLSIGTSRPTAEKKGFKGTIKHSFDSMTNPEHIHDIMEKRKVKDSLTYYRFNQPGLVNLEMDHWKPKGRFVRDPGSATFEVMDNMFNYWYADHHEEIRLCAEDLVARRRDRTIDSRKWERWATVSRYRCRIRKCEVGKFELRTDWENHLKGVHNMDNNAVEAELKESMDRWHYRPADLHNGS